MGPVAGHTGRVQPHHHHMRLIPLLGAAALAVASPAPAPAQVYATTSGTPLYAKAIAIEVCRFQRAGMSADDAITRAIKLLWPAFATEIMRDDSKTFARYVVGERLILCPEVE